MKVSFDGMNEKLITFEAAEGVQEGSLVKVSGAGKVAPCGSGDVPVGVARQVRGDICGVQVQGYAKVSCAADVAVGFGLLASDGSGKLTVGTSGRPGYVLDVDSAAGVCGVLL